MLVRRTRLSSATCFCRPTFPPEVGIILTTNKTVHRFEVHSLEEDLVSSLAREHNLQAGSTMSHKKRKFEPEDERNLHHVFAAAAKVRSSILDLDNLRKYEHI